MSEGNQHRRPSDREGANAGDVSEPESEGEEDALAKVPAALSKLDYWIVGGIMLLSIAAVLFPGLVYAPVQKAVLYFLISIMGAILMGRIADATAIYESGGVYLKITGIWVVVFSSVLLLNHITKPEVRVVVFDFYYKGDELQITTEGAFNLKGGGAGTIQPTVHKVNNHVILQFPEQVYEVEAEIAIPSGERFKGKLTYEPTQTREIALGKDPRFHLIND